MQSWALDIFFSFATTLYIFNEKKKKNAQNLQVSVSKWISNKEQITRRKLKKIENILTLWSVAQAGSNEEKKEVENLVGLSL